MDPRVEQYVKNTHKRVVKIFVFCILLLVLAIVSFAACSIKMSVGEAIQVIIAHLNGFEPSNYKEMLKDRLVFSYNVPRAIGAVCAGGILACGGATMQSLIRNPLADPYTLGISSGALFGMVLWAALGISLAPFVTSGDAQFYNAFLMALVPTAVVVLVSAFKKVSPTMMILCGIGVMYIFSAFTTIIKYSTDSDTLKNIYLWTVGSIGGLVWGSLPKMVFAFLLCFVPMMILSNKIDIVSQGDNGAMSLGVNPNRLRIFFLVLISISTAIIVCYSGTIGFVGLVAPHIARIFVGSKSSTLIPCSAVIGAFMVLGADYLVRLFFPILSVGVILAIFCSPVFIYLLVKMKRGAW